MKKYLLILLLLIPFTTFGAIEEKFCLAGQCTLYDTNSVMENITINGITGTATMDFSTYTLTFDNFVYDIDDVSDFYMYDQQSMYTNKPSWYAFVYSSTIDLREINFVFKGTNTITLKDLNIDAQYDWNTVNFIYTRNNEFNMIGQGENAKLNLYSEEQTNNMLSTSLFYSYFYTTNAKTSTIKNLELNYHVYENSSDNIKIITAVALKIENCKINIDIEDNYNEQYDFQKIDINGIGVNNLEMINTDYNFHYYRAQNSVYAISSINVKLVNSTLNMTSDVGSTWENLIYCGQITDSKFDFKDSSLSINDKIDGMVYIWSKNKADITLDNTEISVPQGKYVFNPFYWDEEGSPGPVVTTTLLNYDDKRLICTLKNANKEFYEVSCTEDINWKSVVGARMSTPGKINSDLDIKDLLDIPREVQNYIDLGYDVTLSVTQEIINPTESIINLINNNKGDKEVLDYFDINVVVHAEEEVKITELKKKIKLEIDLLDKYKNNKSSRTYTVLRIHDDVVEELETKVENNKLVFETNKFSTYVLTYKDSVKNPQTGDNLYIFILLSFISSFLLITMINKRTRKI